MHFFRCPDGSNLVGRDQDLAGQVCHRWNCHLKKLQQVWNIPNGSNLVTDSYYHPEILENLQFFFRNILKGCHSECNFQSGVLCTCWKSLYLSVYLSLSLSLGLSLSKLMQTWRTKITIIVSNLIATTFVTRMGKHISMTWWCCWYITIQQLTNINKQPAAQPWVCHQTPVQRAPNHQTKSLMSKVNTQIESSRHACTMVENVSSLGPSDITSLTSLP